MIRKNDQLDHKVHHNLILEPIILPKQGKKAIELLESLSQVDQVTKHNSLVGLANLCHIFEILTFGPLIGSNLPYFVIRYSASTNNRLTISKTLV